MEDTRSYGTGKPQGHSIAPALSLVLIFLLLAPVVTFSGGSQKTCDRMRIIDNIFSFRQTTGGRSSPTARLATGRMFHTTTMLNDGDVLIAGGVDGLQYHPLTSAEVYAVNTARFRVTGSLNAARIYFTATLLADGTVLVVGGSDGGWNEIASAELYDPAFGSFKLTQEI